MYERLLAFGDISFEIGKYEMSCPKRSQEKRTFKMVFLNVDLKTAFEEFVSIFNLSEKSFGIVQMRSPVMFDPPFVLGGALTEYFSQLVLKDDPLVSGSMQLMLFPLEELTTAQSGWRWIRDNAGNLVENENWNSSWVVIADRDGDVIFVDTESQNGSTYGSIQQNIFLISNNFADFISTLAQCMVVEKYDFGYETLDDEYNIVESFLVKVKSIAENNLGFEGGKSFMKFFFS